jgi:hypothetical protein
LSVIFVNILDLLLHLTNLANNLIVLTLEEIQVVVAIIDLTARTLVLDLDTRHTMVHYWPINCRNFSVVAYT